MGKMKLENKFFNSFFYPFLIGIFLSTIIVTIFLGVFTNSFYDEKTLENIFDLETKFSKINIKSVNVILTSILQKNQASMNEQILLYQKIANITINTDLENLKLNEDKLKCVYDLTDEYLENNKDILDYLAYWYINDKIKSFDNVTDIRAKKQIISFGNIILNLYATLAASSRAESIFEYFFFFEETDLFFSFPVSYDYHYDYLGIFTNFTSNPFWCTNESGHIYTVYNIKCRDFYTNIKKAITDIYDYNYIEGSNRTIYITNFYKQLDTPESDNVYTMCIRFYDPISKGNGYACSDVSQEGLIFGFDSINYNLQGYYFIACVGFNNVFFFPNSRDSPKTIMENIFQWDGNFSLEEKTFFFDKIQKKLTSSYNKRISFESYEEIYINGNEPINQSFYINDESYNFSVYPVILNNIYGKREHVLSIIYIYNKNLYLSELNISDSSFVVKIILILAIFIIFGWGLLHIVILTFNTLSKYIVIPIKNVNYMLKGINIGGKYRLDFIDYLRKKADDNLEKLEKMYLFEEKQNNVINNNDIDINESSSSISGETPEKNIISTELDESKKKLELKENNDINEEEMMKADHDNFINKYDEESLYIEREINFYDFDEALLRYRSLEIENIVKLLIDIKEALILTSSDRPIEQIIDYSHTEDVFRNYKNNEGTTICQSNIGNLQMQLMKYDKAIYHLAISLQDNRLKKFLGRSLIDELDERDSLLNRISNAFNKLKIKNEKNNILIMKQQSNMSDTFSQKVIGILINTRYNRLVYAYYKFFKGMQKLQKISHDMQEGQFMNTHFHTIDFYHKIIIQYIYLSYVKNDLIKIGESILDYIEFLIKFKLKTSSGKNNFLKIQNNERQEYKEKQKLKKKIFNKIINWFNLFDDYITYVKDNTSIGDDKNIVNDFSHTINSVENRELNSSSQSVFLFKINIQRSEFLKAKLALCCKNYNDALFYFIRSAKKNSLVIDGLIKKRSLKHIFKIMQKLKKKYEAFGLIKLPIKEKIDEFDKIQKAKKHSGRKKLTNISKNNEENNENKKESFFDEIQIIKNDLIKDINECNAQQAKDIIILIDFNQYLKTENNDTNMNKIDAFILQTKTILNDYLSSNDRIAVFIYIKQYHIISPLVCKCKIDIKNFYKDLLYFKNISLQEKKGQEEYDIILEEFKASRASEFELGGKEFNELSQDEEESSDYFVKTEIKYNLIEGFIETINYIKNYSKMKEGIKNEKYLIIFTDFFNDKLIRDEKVKHIFSKLKENKESILLLVGKNKIFKHMNENCFDENEEENDFLYELIMNKFGEKSEIINFENMTKIKTILSYNNVIKDEIIYPNEIYK